MTIEPLTFDDALKISEHMQKKSRDRILRVFMKQSAGMLDVRGAFVEAVQQERNWLTIESVAQGTRDD